MSHTVGQAGQVPVTFYLLASQYGDRFDAGGLGTQKVSLTMQKGYNAQGKLCLSSTGCMFSQPTTPLGHLVVSGRSRLVFLTAPPTMSFKELHRSGTNRVPKYYVPDDGI